MSQIRNASDSTCKKLFRDDGCFADICNYAFFQGKQIIKPEELVSRENDVSTLMGKELLPMETKRYRDIVRKASINGDYMIIGVEHQSTLMLYTNDHIVSIDTCFSDDISISFRFHW